MSDVETSEWQKRIEGEWHGIPGLFDAQGNHVGFEYIARASEVTAEGARYWMDSKLSGAGPLRNRFELGAQFDFGVVDSDENRVYTGPDFYGTGQPYGLFVDANYYSPGWQADLRTWNQVLADGETQVYSSVLHDGWTVCAVFNGVYLRTLDRETNPETQRRVDEWRALEMERGSKPQVLPTKESGAWVGELFLNGADQSAEGKVQVEIAHTPTSLRSARHTITWSGDLERQYAFDRYRDGARTMFEGPEVYGNATGYGRALFTVQHLVGKDAEGAEKIRGREFLIDPTTRELAIVWQLMHGDTTTHFVHGSLQWEAR
ncbi:hypothetical protein NODU109028_07470 [Nocardioides dubius]|uniref:Lipocalin-like domain-containing protein n=1 Tax=Nocardioides dubius TaxID=317019 RepID=A0ABP4EJP0_9ACTN